MQHRAAAQSDINYKSPLHFGSRLLSFIGYLPYLAALAKGSSAGCITNIAINPDFCYTYAARKF